ncbi:MAG TPA: site-specific DNA-methyltransferase [Polyangiaceae bacterium]
MTSMKELAPVGLAWAERGVPAPPPRAALRRSRPGSERYRLIEGDNIAALAALREEFRSSVTLAYLDPPFFTGREHERLIRSRNPESGDIERRYEAAFDDRWSGLAEYLEALRDRVAATRDLLAPHGCLVLHVDPKTSHYAKVLCDEIFGPRCFASEIVWRYRRWPSKTRNFQRVHDVLLRYVRDPEQAPRFRQLYEPLAPSTLVTWGDRKQRAVVDAQGRRRRSSRTSEPTPGTPLGDVWEIGIVAPVARERTGYPTQKPLALLQRLIEACTDPDDWVLDPYLGSGTTMSASGRLGRRSIGIDLNPEALSIARKRLWELRIAPLEQRVLARPLRPARPAAQRARVSRVA